MFIWSFDRTIETRNDWESRYHGTFLLVDGTPVNVSVGTESSTLGGKHFPHDGPDEGVFPVIERFYPKNRLVTIPYKKEQTTYAVKRLPARTTKRSMASANYSVRAVGVTDFEPRFTDVVAAVTSPKLDCTTVAKFVESMERPVEFLTSMPLDEEYCICKEEGIYSIRTSYNVMAGLIDWRNKTIYSGHVHLPYIDKFGKEDTQSWNIVGSVILDQ
jgi:hypothetical protein